MNYDWPLSREAVDAVGTGRSGDASLGYSSRNWATGWFQPGFQSGWDDDADAFWVSCGASSFWGACRVFLEVGDSPYHDLLREGGGPHVSS